MLAREMREALHAAGVIDTPELLDALLLHAEKMLEANAVQNLTRITAERDVAVLHVGDSLAALPYLVAAPEGPFADMGSGAGYPAIPLALVSKRRVAMVESRGKKAAFLERVLDALALDGEVFPIRVEEIPGDRHGTFTAVTARALAPLASLVELAAPLLRPDGVLIALKGEPSAEELEAGDAAARVAGLDRTATDHFILPRADARRTIVVYRRVRPPRVPLPRRVGLAQHEPLA